MAILGNIKMMGILALVMVLGYGYMKIEGLEASVERKDVEIQVLHDTVDAQKRYFESKIKADLATLENRLAKEKLVEGLDVQDDKSVDIGSNTIWF